MTAVEATRAWIESVVVGLGLCPFALDVLEAGRVRIAQSEARDPETLLADLDAELARLLRTPVAELDTTILVHPRALLDFVDYLDFQGAVEALLADRGCEGVVQVATFHPDYVFADSAPDDPANWTNRSPYPMHHLLREQSVSDAVDGHPDIESVPSRNAERLRELGAAELERRLAACRQR